LKQSERYIHDDHQRVAERLIPERGLKQIFGDSPFAGGSRCREVNSREGFETHSESLLPADALRVAERLIPERGLKLFARTNCR